MGFDNFTPEEKERLGQLLATPALRPRLRTLQTLSSGGNSSNTNNSKKKQQDEEEEEGKATAMVTAEELHEAATSTSAECFSQMGYVDRVVAALDALQFRYALQQHQKEAHDNATANNATTTTTGDVDGDASSNNSDKDPTVRPVPYPSLFLNSPAEFVRESWGSGGNGNSGVAMKRPERLTAAAALSNVCPARAHPPPAAFSPTNVAGEKIGTTGVVGITPSGSADGIVFAAGRGGAASYLLDLSGEGGGRGDGGAAAASNTTTSTSASTTTASNDNDSSNAYAVKRVVVALQSEASLAVYTDYANNSNSSARNDVYVMSPDATTCVVVACRVALHSAWREAIARHLVAVGDDVDRINKNEKCGVSVSFPSRVASTATAAIVHLDTDHGAVDTVSDMLWRGAVPAWLHAIAAHLKSPTRTDGKEEEGVQESKYDDVLAAVAALNALHLFPSTTTGTTATAATAPPLVSVEWYLVGGVREKKYTAPVLTALFSHYFPNSGRNGTEEAAGDATPPSTSSSPSYAAPLQLLSSQRRLSTLIASASPPPPPVSDHVQNDVVVDADVVGDCTIHISHRLREDSICVWSYNTTFLNWSMDRNPKNLYTFPLCHGLMVNVASGAAWPCQVAPGKRGGYALSRLRTALMFRYHCTFPLEHERSAFPPQTETSTTSTSASASASASASECASTKKDQRQHQQKQQERETSTVTETAIATTAVNSPLQVHHQTASAVAAAERHWSIGAAGSAPLPPSFSSSPYSLLSSSSQQLHSLTLGGFVARCLDVLCHNQQQQQQVSSSCSSSPSSQQPSPSQSSSSSRVMRAFPFLFRTTPTPEPLWAYDPVESTHSRESVRSMPPEIFLQTSTTPHCEPPDFCDTARSGFMMMHSVGPAEMFRTMAGLPAVVTDITGKKTTKTTKRTGRPVDLEADGVLFVV